MLQRAVAQIFQMAHTSIIADKIPYPSKKCETTNKYKLPVHFFIEKLTYYKRLCLHVLIQYIFTCLKIHSSLLLITNKKEKNCNNYNYNSVASDALVIYNVCCSMRLLNILQPCFIRIAKLWKCSNVHNFSFPFFKLKCFIPKILLKYSNKQVDTNSHFAQCIHFFLFFRCKT